MSSILTRKSFLQVVSFGCMGMVGAAVAVNGQEKKDKPPALPPELVKEFVTKAHNDLDRVKVLLAQEPGLLNAWWDWGGGDFETAMEAAGHMGLQDTANFLLSNGARMNIFCAAMLGKLGIVKGMLTAFPELKNSKGPHGLKLIHHATKGGAEAVEVLSYLKSIGAA